MPYFNMTDALLEMSDVDIELNDTDFGSVQDSLDVKLPYILKNKTFLSPGVWNNYEYTPDAIAKIFQHTTWNDETMSLYYDHQSRSAANWVGEVKNVRLEHGKVMGDVYIVDKNAAIKLQYGAKWGISPKIKGYCYPNSVQLYDGLFEDFSVVRIPAVKTAYLNSEQSIDVPYDNIVIILNSEISETTPQSIPGARPLETPLSTTDFDSKITEFLKANPNPTDDMVHKFAASIGKPPEEVEQVIYKIATRLVAGGGTAGAGSKKTGGRDKPDSEFDAEQIKKGIEVEKEHTDDLGEAKAIAKDHLVENGKYYDYLDEMEKKMKITDNKSEVTNNKMAEEQKLAGCVPPVADEDKDKKIESAKVPEVAEPVKKDEGYPKPIEDAKKEVYPAPEAEDKKEEEKGLNMEELYQLFSDATFGSFKNSFLSANPSATLSDIINAFKEDKKMAELEQRMSQKLEEKINMLSAKIDTLTSAPVERSTPKGIEATGTVLTDIENASNDPDRADELMAEFFTATLNGKVKL